MFEQAQLMVEETLNRAIAGARRRLSVARQRLSEYAFWDYARVRDDSRLHGFPSDTVTAGSVDLHAALQELRLMLFAEGTDRDLIHFDVVGSDSAARHVRTNLLEERLDRHGMSHSIYGYHLWSLEAFLVAVVGDLLIDGCASFHIEFDGKNGSKLVTYLDPIESTDLRRVRLGNKRGSFRHVKRSTHPVEKSPPSVEYYPADEVLILVLEPPLTSEPGKSRLQNARQLAREQTKKMSAMLAAAYAGTNPSDHRLWVERARWESIPRLLEKTKSLGVQIRSLIGGSVITAAGSSFTPYYEIFDSITFRWRLAKFRESLVGQINTQLVTRLLEKNGFATNGAALALSNLHSSDEWQTILGQFMSGEISRDNAAKILWPDMAQTSPNTQVTQSEHQ